MGHRWLLVDEPDREPALAVRDRIQAGRLETRQPPHFPIEVASALVVAGRAGRLEPSTIGPLVRSLGAALRSGTAVALLSELAS